MERIKEFHNNSLYLALERQFQHENLLLRRSMRSVVKEGMVTTERFGVGVGDTHVIENNGIFEQRKPSASYECDLNQKNDVLRLKNNYL